MTVDPVGNIWLTGKDNSGLVPVTPDAAQKQLVSSTCDTTFPPPVNPTPCNDAFVVKLDSSGKTVLYASYLGGQSDDGGTAIAVDPAGNIYIAGFTYSSDFPTTEGAFQTKNAGPAFGQNATGFPGGGDAFVTKLNPDGSVSYSTLIGGAGNEYPTSIRVDASGFVYVAGVTASTDFPVTPGALRNTNSTMGAFLAKLNTRGSALIYGTYFDASINAIAIDSVGAVYLTGQTDGSLTTTPGAAQPRFGGVLDAYVSKIDRSGGKLLYSTYLGGQDIELAASIAVDAVGSVWVVGETYSPDFPQLGQGGGAFIVKLTPDGGGIAAARGIGNNNSNNAGSANTVSLDSVGNAYVVGDLGAVKFPATPNAALKSPCTTLGGAFLLKINPSGEMAYASYLRQPAFYMTVTPAGRVVLSSGSGVKVTQLDPSVPYMINFGCPVNAASFVSGSSGVSPGEIVTLSGYGIGPEVGVSAQRDASGRISSSLAGVQVRFNGVAAPILYAQSEQINAIVPFELVAPTSDITIEVQYNGNSARPLNAPLSSIDPGIFTLPGKPANAGAILNHDGTINSATNPAKLGSVISLFVTGVGPLNAPSIDGEIAPLPPPFLLLKYPWGVQFAGVDCKVVYAGAAPTLVLGAALINAQLPSAVPPGMQPGYIPLTLQNGGLSSPPVLVNVRP